MMESIEVFETSDLPEVDQALLSRRDDVTTDSIETLNISTNEAFGRFKGAYVDSDSVDFSDKLRTSRRKGYNIVWTGEPPKEEETPLKKYQRLNCEARELQDELTQAKDNKKSGISDGTLETMSGQVEILHKHLLQLRLEEVLGQQTLHTMTDPQAAARQKLLTQIEQLKKPKVESCEDKSNVPSYSLQLRASTESPEQAILASLESRLFSLEATLGLDKENFSVLCMETNRKTVTQAVQVLTAKTSLLDPYYLDHVEGRLAALQQKMIQLQDQKSNISSESAAKLDTLLAVAEKSQGMYTTLPDTVHRMETLQTLHMQAADFSRSLLELETVQQQLSVQLGNNLGLLNSTKEKLAANLKHIHKNFDSLFARIDKLQQKKKK